MTDIRLVDVSIRDGNQSLWGATGLGTPQILEIAPTLNRVGFQALDFTSSTHMAVAVRYSKEDPWERIRLMHQAAPDTPLQFITTGLRFISWETADAEFMRLVYRRLAASGMERFIVLDPMHDLDGLLSAARLVKEEGGKDVMAALTYTISDVHDDAFYADLARAIAKSQHVDRAYIKDPAGILTPERARTLIPAVQAALGAMPLELHSHCTIGLVAAHLYARGGARPAHAACRHRARLPTAPRCPRRRASSPICVRSGTASRSTTAHWRCRRAISPASPRPRACPRARRRSSTPPICITRSPAASSPR